MKKVLVVLLVLVVAVGGFLYFPRGAALDALNAAVLGVLQGDMDTAKAGKDFLPALDGDVMANGDVVRANEKGRGILTFFDASTVSVDPNSNVRVTALARTSGGGLSTQLEQTIGRTWSSVTKQASPDAKFQIKTPTLTATVRGTGFETIVVKGTDGKLVTTIKVQDGQVIVEAAAGGQVLVGPGQQVQIAEGQQAPASASPQPSARRLRFVAASGVAIVVVDPRGYQCGQVGTAIVRMTPTCVIGGPGQVDVSDVVAGTYTVVASATQAVANPGIGATGFGPQGSTSVAMANRALGAGDLVRTTLPVTVGTDGAFATTGFAQADVLASICGSEAAGRIISTGDLSGRADQLIAFARAQKGQPVTVMYTQADLTKGAADAVAQATLPVTVTDPKVTVDYAGMHVTATLGLAFLSVPARGDIVAGSEGGRLVLRLRNLDGGIIPPAATEQLVTVVNNALADYASQLPIVVSRVAFRTGCVALIGRTPS